jgi:hypothetical protein
MFSQSFAGRFGADNAAPEGLFLASGAGVKGGAHGGTAAFHQEFAIGKSARCPQISNMSFETLVEKIRTCSVAEKEELKFLLERALIEERRREIRANHRRSLDEVKRGKLKFSNSIADLKKSLAA